MQRTSKEATSKETYYSKQCVNYFQRKRTGIKQTPPSLTKLFKKCSISNDLDNIEDAVLWAEHYENSDTDSNEESNNMYDDTQTDTTDVQ